MVKIDNRVRTCEYFHQDYLEDVRNAVELLDNYKTLRPAREFCEVVNKKFVDSPLDPKRRKFRDLRRKLIFPQRDSLEVLSFLEERTRRTITGYTLFLGDQD